MLLHHLAQLGAFEIGKEGFIESLLCNDVQLLVLLEEGPTLGVELAASARIGPLLLRWLLRSKLLQLLHHCLFGVDLQIKKLKIDGNYLVNHGE